MTRSVIQLCTVTLLAAVATGALAQQVYRHVGPGGIEFRQFPGRRAEFKVQCGSSKKCRSGQRQAKRSASALS